MAKDIKAVILAGGLGTRMKSSNPKVLHNLGGRPMIEYIIDAVKDAGIKDIICVVGHKSSVVKKALKGLKIVEQKRQLGSADALNQTRSKLKRFKNASLR